MELFLTQMAWVPHLTGKKIQLGPFLFLPTLFSCLLKGYYTTIYSAYGTEYHGSQDREWDKNMNAHGASPKELII
jgi:hypothetical protein